MLNPRSHFSFLLLLSACGGGAAPTLAPVAQQSGRVNEELQVTLPIDNPDGRAVDLVVEGPNVPGFDRVTSVSATPAGGVFRWVPLSSHVGTHELTFVLSAPGGAEYDRQSALFTIQAAADAAPVFVRPGAGGTYDLTRSPCVMFDVEVRDDDSASVDIAVRGELPEGATLANAGPKAATFDWCPTPDQVAASERWTIALTASDGDHPEVEHDYVVVLRSGGRDNCPGAPPAITIVSPLADEVVTSGTTYPIRVSVTDDMGLREPPLLYYSTSAPDDPPDVTEMQQASFEPDGAGYVAYVPSLGLGVGSQQRVYFLVSATDNDDGAGSTCDHRVDSPVVSFFAAGGERPDGTLAECAPCAASTECASGICASAASGARCVDSCSGSGVCDMGECGATVTTEGGTRAGCGPVRDLCGGGGPGTCSDDGREDDDTTASATTYSTPITDGQICADDDDYFRIDGAFGDRVTVTLDGFTHAAGDLDLQLRSSTGTILASSATVRDMESASACIGEGADRVYARVFGFMGAQNAYALSVDREAGACCTDDGGEPDDTRSSARPLVGTDFDGTICPMDDDWIAVPVTGPSRIEATLIFTHAMGDLDLELYAPDGTLAGYSRGITDEESIGIDVGTAGTYALRVFGYGGAGNQYLGMVTLTARSGCTTSRDCAFDRVCSAGTCIPGACTGTCPAMHTCSTGGPPPAANWCAMACTVNADCRSTEACKWFPEGRGCGARGSAANGDACATLADCGGQRACLSWPRGYCARAGCTSNSDCESGTYCVAQGGLNVCAKSCVVESCRDADGYTCAFRPTLGGTDRFVCVPSF